MGDRPEDPCGKDWKPIGGDFGDPDLAAAIGQTRQMGKNIPLVTFGHMHHKLRHTQQRLRKQFDVSTEGTVYYNGAVAPRIVEKLGKKQRQFSIVSLQKGIVGEIAIIWLNQQFQVISEEIIYRPKPDSLAQSA